MNVADITLMAGDPGHDHVEVLLAAGEHGAEDREQPERQHTPKNAALGLRQNIRRSSRYWRHAALHQAARHGVGSARSR